MSSIVVHIKNIRKQNKNLVFRNKKMCFKLRKEKQGEELFEEAKKLGVATDGIFQNSTIREGALQERVRSAKNTRYARLTWVIALISAIASAISAIAAWYAVLK